MRVPRQKWLTQSEEDFMLSRLPRLLSIVAVASLLASLLLAKDFDLCGWKHSRGELELNLAGFEPGLNLLV